MEKTEKSYKGRLLSLIGIILIFILGWIYFYYPAATIVITPEIATVKQEITALGSPGQEKIDWDNNILPLHKFQVSLTDEAQIAVTGEKKIGNTKACGNVRFINEKEEEVEIPAGTVLIAKNNKKYKTTADIIVSAMKVDYLMDVQVGRKAGQTEVEVVALEKGSDGNISIGDINKFAHPMENVHVINPEPIRGGTDIVKKIVAESDIEQLKKNLDEKIKTRLLNKIYQKLSGNYRLIEEEIKYSKVDYNFNHKAGDITSLLSGNATLIAEGYLIKNNEIDRLATNIFRENLKNSQRLLSKGIIIENIELAETGKGLYNILMESAGPVIPEIDIDSIRKKIKGNSLEKVHNILAEEENISEYKVESRNNSEKLPGLSFTIKVITNEPQVQQVINIK